jgi:hypothetical protein
MYNKICPICNKEFKTNKTIQKYCGSKKCLKEYNKLNQRAYNKTPKRKKYMQKRFKNNYNNNSLFKLRHISSVDIYESIKKYNKVKPKYPFNIKELKTHLENQFDNKMNWDNFGRYWDLEHKIPISWFDNAEDLIKYGWHLENLTPLEKINNIKKGNKYAVVGEEIFLEYEDAITEFIQLINKK